MAHTLQMRKLRLAEVMSSRGIPVSRAAVLTWPPSLPAPGCVSGLEGCSLEPSPPAPSWGQSCGGYSWLGWGEKGRAGV